MNYDIEKQLNNLPKKKLSKRADFTLRFRLLMTFWQKKIIDFPVAFSWPRLRLTPVIAVLLLIVIVTVPGYAYASASVTDGHWLYPVKTAIEQVELNLAHTPEAQVKAYEKLADRRLAEADILSKQGGEKEDNLVKTVDRAVSLTESAADVAATAPSPEVKELVDQAQVEQTGALAKVAQNIGINAREDTVDRIALALDKVKRPRATSTPLTRDKQAAPANEDQAPPLRATGTVPVMASSTPDRGRPSANGWQTPTPPSRLASTSIKEFLNRFNRTNAGTDADKGTTTEPHPAFGAGDAGTDNDNAGSRSPRTVPDETASGSTAERSLDRTKSDIEKLKRTLPRDRYRSEDVDSLFQRLDDKLKKAEDAYRDHDQKSLDDTLDATDAITNNATSFIRPLTDENNGNSHDNGKHNGQTKDTNDTPKLKNVPLIPASPQADNADDDKKQNDGNNKNQDTNNKFNWPWSRSNGNKK